MVSLHSSPLAQPGKGDAGGMNVYLVCLAESLQKQGVDVELITRASEPDSPQHDYTSGGVIVRFLDAGPRTFLRTDQLTSVTSSFSAGLAQLPRFDLIHSHYWLSALSSLPVAQKQGLPHLLSLHTVAAQKNLHLAPGDKAESEERLRAESDAVQSSLFTIAHTPAEKKTIVETYRGEKDRVRVIFPGVDSQFFHPKKHSHASDPYVLVIGRIQPLKGHDLALHTLAEIPSSIRPDLFIVGEPTPGDEDYYSYLNQLAKKLAISDRVFFIGAQSRENAALFLRNAHAVLIPSHSETFSLVALEAAASGTPVIAMNTTGLSYSIKNDVSGYLINSREPQKWADALKKILTQETTRNELARSAVDYARKHDWEFTAATMIDLYKKALRG